MEKKWARDGKAAMASSTSTIPRPEEPPAGGAGAGDAKNRRARGRRNRNRRRKKAEAKSRYRNWADGLPWPALTLILTKLGGVEVLMSAQRVCRSWWKASLDPCLWRATDLTGHADLVNAIDTDAMAKVAIDRSKGQMQEFHAEYIGSDDLLRYLADSASNLKHLQLIGAYKVSDDGLAAVMGRFSLLEQVDITNCSFDDHVSEVVGKACPLLKCFRLNAINNVNMINYSDADEDGEVHMFNEEAFGVANTMPGLRRLQLVANCLDNEGLNAILDKCVHLESLDIRRCYRVNLDAKLRAKFAKIKELRLPYDSTEDYGWVFDDGCDDPYSDSCHSPDYLFYDYLEDYDDFVMEGKLESMFADSLGLFHDDDSDYYE